MLLKDRPASPNFEPIWVCTSSPAQSCLVYSLHYFTIRHAIFDTQTFQTFHKHRCSTLPQPTSPPSPPLVERLIFRILCPMATMAQSNTLRTNQIPCPKPLGSMPARRLMTLPSKPPNERSAPSFTKTGYGRCHQISTAAWRIQTQLTNGGNATPRLHFRLRLQILSQTPINTRVLTP